MKPARTEVRAGHANLTLWSRCSCYSLLATRYSLYLNEYVMPPVTMPEL